MANLTIDHSDVPIRLFKSDFLEFFTHISPVAIVIIWSPVMLFFLYRASIDPVIGAAPLSVLSGFLIGILVWSFTEYTVHRFVFHFEPRTPRQEKIIFLFHGIHHLQPQIKTRLVMPPIVSVPLAFIFYGLFQLIVGALIGQPQWIAPLFAGFIGGYLLYDLTHYATHHLPMRWGFLKYLKRYHMMHHYKTPEQRFGVSTPLWDFVFRTMPKEEQRA
jgi:sterol desaturase/sphingolipid hydroxylase (fatty acid hydroxylase superfamily)